MTLRKRLSEGILLVKLAREGKLDAPEVNDVEFLNRKKRRKGHKENGYRKNIKQSY